MKFANGFALVPGLLSIVLFQPVARAATDINWVQNELNTQQFTSIEGFLAALPDDYRTRYTLMYDSGSLQEATPAKPRVISYGTDGSLIFAYNSGDPSLHGSDTVELIQFNQPEAKFEFYEISKSSATGRLQLTAQTTKCEACHRSDPRPNWQPYDNWPGAYGSDDDRLESLPTEQTGYVSFLEKAASNPRYATLLNLPAITGPTEIELPDLPNTNMVDEVAQWNYMRAARLVRATKDYDSYKYAILGVANCTSQFANFFPATNPPPSNWNTQGDIADPWAAAFIYLFDSRKIDWRDWTMLINGVESNYFDNDPFIAGYTYGQDLIANIAKQDVELQAYAQVSEASSYAGVTTRSVFVQDCSALAKLSVKALSAL